MEQPTVRFKLNDKQQAILDSIYPESFGIGGRGMGKSFILGLLLYFKCAIPGSVGLLAAPTNDQLRNSTLRQVLIECWQDKLGLVEGIHYVINEMPKKEWGIDAFSKLQNTKILTTAFGSYVVLDSLENFNKHRGAAYDYILVDEFRDVSHDVRKVLLGCRRGKAYKQAGLPIQIYYVTTPPEDPTGIEELKEKLKDKALFVQGSSYDNEANLPPGYIKDMEEALDDDSIQREVYGQLVNSNNRPFIQNFKSEKYVTTLCDYNPLKPIYFWMDFNTGIMATLVIQFDKDYIHFIDEFEPQHNIDIEDRCDSILNSLYAGKLRTCIVTGDPARGATGILKNVDYYMRIKALLNLKTDQIKVRKSHMFVKDSRVLVNSIFSRFPKVRINPRCKNLIKDLRFCKINDKGELDKKTNPKLTHYLDAMRYGLEYHFSWWLMEKRNNMDKKRRNHSEANRTELVTGRKEEILNNDAYDGD